MSKKLGAQIKKARTEKGLTQAALAKKVKGLTASDISRIERGEKEPDQETLKALAKALEVTQASLNGTGSGKTTAKKTTAKKTAAKKTGKTGAAAAGDLKLTAAEKKLVQLYRKADAETKKTAAALLDGTASLTDLLASALRGKVSGSSRPSSAVQDLLGSLLSGGTPQNSGGTPSDSGSDMSMLGDLLGNLLGKH